MSTAEPTFLDQIEQHLRETCPYPDRTYKEYCTGFQAALHLIAPIIEAVQHIAGGSGPIDEKTYSTWERHHMMSAASKAIKKVRSETDIPVLTVEEIERILKSPQNVKNAQEILKNLNDTFKASDSNTVLR